jgi:hypothetical protein
MDSVYTYYGDETTSTADKTFLMIQSIASAITIVCEIGIFAETFADYRAGVSTIVSRTMCWVNVSFFFCSVGNIIANIPVPEQIPGVWGAFGNQATCSTQGSVRQFGIIASGVWDIILSLTFLLIIHYNTPDFKLQKWEPYFHGAAWLPAIGITIAAAIQDVYNYDRGGCWLNGIPHGCSERGEYCIRGENAITYLIITCGVLMLQIALAMYAMIVIYCTSSSTHPKRPFPWKFILISFLHFCSRSHPKA